MSEFLFLFKGGNAQDLNISPEAVQKQMERWSKWGQQLNQQGRYVGGDQLTSEVKNVTSKTMVTDGPYAEGKEIVGGYMIIKANDLNEATEISKECPIFETHGTVEVREIVKMAM
jgi:hypothetical protein